MTGAPPDVVAFELSEGIAKLKQHGLVMGKIFVTQAPGVEAKDSLRIVKQQISSSGRVDLVAVYEQASLPGKEV